MFDHSLGSGNLGGISVVRLDCVPGMQEGRSQPLSSTTSFRKWVAQEIHGS